eukprot:CAMPEP_0195511984 /NCGR_PEP_ID=MMETSP0794_2-20130614/4116_1 /TAXON_ID=515487 /ORGANISM="Stephanopyxis turris, Strain CCMP 815" /LENGTH=310 /DNA_ID=CAMNT_0040639693 /DNA_START=70 /DNA_END=998 /DNA_ORIENTATION=+
MRNPCFPFSVWIVISSASSVPFHVLAVRSSHTSFGSNRAPILLRGGEASELGENDEASLESYVGTNTLSANENESCTETHNIRESLSALETNILEEDSASSSTESPLLGEKGETEKILEEVPSDPPDERSGKYISVKKRREEALSLRVKGKRLHDESEWATAAQAFRQAGGILDELLEEELRRREERQLRTKEHQTMVFSNAENSNENDEGNALQTEGGNDANEEPINRIELAEEAATCHLHEALCELKNDNPEKCLHACTAVIHDEDPHVDDDEENLTGEHTDTEGEQEKEDVIKEEKNYRNSEGLYYG